MSIRTDIAKVISGWRIDNSKTYVDMTRMTGLNNNQLNRLIKHEGKGLSIDLMEQVCLGLGIKVQLEVKDNDYQY